MGSRGSKPCGKTCINTGRETKGPETSTRESQSAWWRDTHTLAPRDFEHCPAWDEPGDGHREQTGAGVGKARSDIVSLPPNFFRDFPEATAQGSQIVFPLLFARFVAAQIEDQLWVVLARQFSLDGALEFCRHSLQLVRFLLGQLLQVPLQVPRAFAPAGFECCQQGIAVPTPEGLKTGLDGGWGAGLSDSFERGLGLADVKATETAFDEGIAPAVMISSCRRRLSPPNTTMRP